MVPMQEILLRSQMSLSAKFFAMLSYCGVLSLVPLIVSRDDSYVRFHARQGVVLWMWEVLAVYTLFIPGLGQLFFRFSVVACLVLSLIGMLAVLLGRAWQFPVIGVWAKRL